MTSMTDPHLNSYRGVSPGTRLNGIYEIDRMIGAGGMGEVYKCREIQTDTPVAIKMLLPDMAENEAALALFRREAAALHNLPHDAIVRYFLFTVEPVLQRPYLAMEFVDGRSLSDVIQDGPLTFEAVVNLMRRIASGLHAAHVRGIIHRDVSPDNIILPLGDVSRAKIIDFGIARSTQLADKTIIGNGFAGKENYVSPEQVGLFGNDVTAKSDVYSLGLLLFYALTGEKLDMGGSQFQLVEKRRRIPDLGGIDLRIRPLFERMLQPDPVERASMADIANWQVGTDNPSRGFDPFQRVEAPMPGKAAPATHRRRWSGFIAAGVAGALLVGGAGYAFYTFVWSTPDAPPPRLVLDGKLNSAKSDQAAPDIPRPTAVPTAPPVTSSPPRNETERLRKYIEDFKGGDCFFVLPVAVSSNAAVVEGFGAASPPFDAFGKAFKRDLGFDASVGVRQVTQAQCPAIRFLGQVGANQARAPRINLRTTDAKAGDPLEGTIENFANRVVELLLVSETGDVQNVSYALKPGLDSLAFAVPMPRGGPQLLMAIATPRVLDALRQPRPVPADTFFLQALGQAQRDNVIMTTTARYIALKN
jgi:hypothetical protein